jgi:tetratricopeptide (TPR) repeat protein/predicted Ser/Thr protein kinase
MPPFIGASVGHIRIVGQLGEGGMGEVYVGVDETLQRRVALKVIRADSRLDPVARARFLREARILSQLDDPRICRIYDYIEGDGADFIVLELIEGRTLTPEVTQSLLPGERLRVAVQLAAVIALAHQRGIIHRDLKPGNVMLTDAGLAKVLDFGIAQVGVASPGPDPATVAPAPQLWIDSASETVAAGSHPGNVASGFTERGVISGSAGYMSPEQARGETVTIASDVYSLGLLFQELFTGRSPFPSGLPALELVRRASQAESLPVEGIDPDLSALIARMKSAAPAARPTAGDVVDRLHGIIDKPKRRRRRYLAAAAICLVALGVLKYTTDLRTARNEAERRRGQAEDLITFMLGDLRQKLAAVGRLEVLDETSAKALSYFDSLPVADQNDAELMRRAKALSQIGEVRVAKGDAEGALEALRESLALADGVVSRHPDRLEWLTTLGATHFWIGYAHWNKGDLAAAREQFTQYRAIATRMVSVDPVGSEAKLELAQSETNLGAVCQAQGQLGAAADHFRAAVALKRELVKSDPNNAARKQDLANGLSWLGDSLRHSGRLREAHLTFQDNASLLGALTTEEPKNVQSRYLRAVNHAKVGLILRAIGQPADALEEDRQSATLAQSLVAHDPLNMDWKRELAVSEVNVAVDLVALERPSEALAHAERGATLLGELVGSDGTNADWRRQLAAAETARAAAHLIERRYASALSTLERAADATRSLPVGNEDRDAARIRAEGHLLAARGREALGQRESASQARRAALETIEPVARDATRTDLLWPYAQALTLLNDAVRAAPVFEKLHASGFRSVDLIRFCREQRCTGEPQ